MPAVLEISDGTPWYLSPDVWTVPGGDPNGSPGLPREGEPCYLWARVHNTGDAADNVTLQFYWADPSTAFDRTSATPIGTSFTSFTGPGVNEVLCLTPWTPSWVNHGHECVLAEAFHPSDPLPASPASPVSSAFDVPTDRHTAQRNLNVIPAVNGAFQMFFVVRNSRRTPAKVALKVSPGSRRELEDAFPDLAKTWRLPDGEGKLTSVGLVDQGCLDVDEIRKTTDRAVSLELGARATRGYTVAGVIEGGPAVVHVVQSIDGVETGGITALVLP